MSQSIKEAVLNELKVARDIADVASKENRGLTDDEQTKVYASFEKAKGLRARHLDQVALNQQLGELSDGIGFDTEAEMKGKPSQYAAPPRMSLGHGFTESAQFKALSQGAPGGRFSEQMRVQSQPWGVKSLLKAEGYGDGPAPGMVTGASDASAGAFVTPQQYGVLDPVYARPLRLRQLVTTGRITTDSVEYVRVVGVANRAAPVPEATKFEAIDPPDVTEVEAGLKPMSGMTFERQTAPTRTLAHWLPATKRSLSDAAQVRTYIDAFLRYGLEEALEWQMLVGGGSGENFEGLEHVSGVQQLAAVPEGITVLDTLRRARTLVEVNGRTRPTGFVMHPIDWEAIELLKDGQDRFLGAGPYGVQTPGIWGLPVVTSEALSPGTAWCADWAKAVLWDREQASITVSDSHENFFVRNIVAILGEMRAAFGVLRPSAFVQVELGGGAAPA